MLTTELLEGSHQFDIPQATLDNEVAALVAEIELIEGFDPTIEFDPEKHLIFTEDDYKKVKKISLSDMGIEKTHVKPISDFGGTDPFPLFSEEAANLMKWEVFKDKELVHKYGRLPNLSKDSSTRDFQISGFADQTRFTKAAWAHPKTQEIINRIVGVNLKMPHVFSMGHVNASLAERVDGAVTEMPAEEVKALREQHAKDADNIPSALHWHYDSPPMVCVMMLSAPEDMIGGETGLRKGDESYITVPGPKVGYATLLQGRVVKHIATKPINKCDRISYITSFIPEDVNVHDTTVCTSERPSAAPTFTNDRFYPNYVNYRFERIEERLKQYRAKLMENYKKEERFDQESTIAFCEEIENYLRGTWNEFELVNDDVFPPPLFSTPYSELEVK